MPCVVVGGGYAVVKNIIMIPAWGMELTKL